MKWWSPIMLGGVLVVESGCVVPARRPAVAVAAPGDGFPAGPPAGPSAAPEEDRVLLEGSGLTIADAIALALARHPALAIAATEIDLSEAARVTALLYPNPDAQITAEAGEMDTPGVPRLWVELRQPIVLSNRRALGAEEAVCLGDAAAYEWVARKLEVIADVRAAFHAEIAAQARVDLADGNLDVTREFLRAAEARHAADRVAEIEVLRARAEVERDRAAGASARARLETARARLARAIGLTGTAPPPAVPVASQPPPVPPAERLAQAVLDAHPAILAARARRDAAEIAVARARAEGVPDLTVGAGYGQSFDPVGSLWTLSVGIPLPLFDRNEGRTAQAEALRARAEAEIEALQAALLADLREAVSSYRGATATLQQVQGSLLPVTEEAYRQAETAYREGKLDYTTLLDARRSRVDARRAEIDALLDSWEQVVRIEMLVGPLDNGEMP